MASLKLTGSVSDLANVVSPADEAALETELRQLQREDGTQVVLLTVPTTNGQPIEEFALQVARENGIGQKGTNNGVLVVLAVEDREARIEVGYGLEGRLTDLLSSQIIRHEMVPLLRQGQLSQGARAGTEAVIAAVKGEYHVRPSTEPVPGLPLRSLALAAGVFVVALILRLVGHRGVALVLFPIWSIAIWLLAAVALQTGFMLAFFATMVALVSFRRRGWVSGFGGGWGGGGWGGGGLGGGGFSGGGGSFGGGGASGSW